MFDTHFSFLSASLRRASEDGVACQQEAGLLEGAPRDRAFRLLLAWCGKGCQESCVVLGLQPGCSWDLPCGEGCRTSLSYLLLSLEFSLHSSGVFGQLTSSWSTIRYQCHPVMREDSALLWVSSGGFPTANSGGKEWWAQTSPKRNYGTMCKLRLRMAPGEGRQAQCFELFTQECGW